MVIKLDIHKAFDSVRWEAIDYLLKAYNFSTTFAARIMACVSSPSFTINLNREDVGLFRGTRGLRQGCPLSLYLFILIMQHLSDLLSAPLAQGHLIPHKKCKKLGRVELIKSMCYWNINFWCSAIKLPVGVISKLNSTLANFRWSRGHRRGLAKVAWINITKPTSHGGLGLCDIDKLNRASFSRHIWNIIQEKNLYGLNGSTKGIFSRTPFDRSNYPNIPRGPCVLSSRHATFVYRWWGIKSPMGTPSDYGLTHGFGLAY